MRLKDLMGLSDEEIKIKLAEFVEDSYRPEVLKNNLERLKQEIEAYEKKYDMTTDELHKKLNSGEMTESSSEICNWLMSADLYNSVIKNG